MVEMTERQAKAWPEAIAEVAKRGVDVDPQPHRWNIQWEDESRPGRGHAMHAVWMDGDHVVEIAMDVYGYPRVAVGTVDWIHNSSDEECECDPCAADRAEEEGLPVLVHWEPRWRPPTVRAACPSCGRVAERRATSWAGHVDNHVTATMHCEDSPGDERVCWRTFNVTVGWPA